MREITDEEVLRGLVPRWKLWFRVVDPRRKVYFTYWESFKYVFSKPYWEWLRAMNIEGLFNTPKYELMSIKHLDKEALLHGSQRGN